MEPADLERPVVQAGDLDGLGKVYSESGDLIAWSGEEVLKTAEGWEINIRSPWRTILPKSIFAGFGGRASSKLNITTERIVLIRQIDVWKELKDELSPLGLPAAAAKEIHLRRLKSAGSQQYCEIRPRGLRIVKVKRSDRHLSLLDLRLVGTDGRQYAITIWKTDGRDPETLTLIASQFAR